MSSGSPSLTILSEEQKFNRENLMTWNITMTQLLGSKGLTGYVNGNIAKPAIPSSSAAAPDTTPIYSTKPNHDEWVFHDQLAQGHITLNCTDVAGLGVVTTGTAKEAWDSIQEEWGKSTDMRRSHAQEALDQTMYAEDSNIQEHLKTLRICKVAVENLSSSTITKENWRGIIIRSILPTPRWLPVLPSLYGMKPADIFATLIAHGMILNRGGQNKPTTGTSNT